MFKFRYYFLTIFFLLLSNASVSLAKEIKISQKGINLKANLILAENKTLKDGIIVMTHGTLAHNKMEIMVTLQQLLSDRGLSSLAINLDLGVKDRKGFYDCATPHTHLHTDAILEIDSWVNWLKSKGAKDLTLLGHSRGGNQIAWYLAEHDDPVIKRVILIAPQTWSKTYAEKNYKRLYKKALQPILNKAQAFIKAGKPEAWMEHTDFIYCKDAKVMAKSFVSYYKPDKRMDTPYLLNKIKKPVLVFVGTEDTVVKNLDKVVAPMADGKKIKLVVIDGADHSFRDLYAEDLVDAIIDFR